MLRPGLPLPRVLTLEVFACKCAKRSYPANTEKGEYLKVSTVGLAEDQDRLCPISQFILDSLFPPVSASSALMQGEWEIWRPVIESPGGRGFNRSASRSCWPTPCASCLGLLYGFSAHSKYICLSVDAWQSLAVVDTGYFGGETTLLCILMLGLVQCQYG